VPEFDNSQASGQGERSLPTGRVLKQKNCRGMGGGCS